MGIWYATRERVMDSLEIMTTSRSARIVDPKIESASLSIEGFLHRRFYPERKTFYRDWPNRSDAAPWRLDLGPEYLISVETLVSGGTTISASDYVLRRWDDIPEPPYQYIDLQLSSSASFSTGDTFQRSIAITGLTGDKDTDTSLRSGTLGATINSSVTSLVVNPSSGLFNVGVGSIILIGTERLIVTARSMSDTTINTAGTLTDRQAARTLAVTDGTNFAVGEVILVDSERMRIDDIAGNNLFVTRAFDGSQLGAHSSGVDVFGLRTCTVKRGQLGSTAASHTLADAVYTHTFPELITELCVAEAVVAIEQNASGYARIVGEGATRREAIGRGLEDIRRKAWDAYGRKQRSQAV